MFDSSGNLYVANAGNDTVSEFAAGGTTLKATYSGLDSPKALAFDSSGNLYVANASNNTVSEFAAGGTTLKATYSGLDNPIAAIPLGLALDSSDNLYVANASNNTVSEFTSGGTTLKATYSGLNNPVVLAFDSGGNLYVANAGNNTVNEFAAGGTTLKATYSGLNVPFALAFDHNGNLYVANEGNNTVSEFAAGGTTLQATYVGLSNPDALAFDSSGNLYVTNGGGDTVSEFSPSLTPTAGGVVIQSSVESRPMLIGGTNSNPVAGVNLTGAELAQIYTISSGAITIGDGKQTGAITLSTAMPATTFGATLNVIQSTSGAGQIILDDGGGTSNAIHGNSGNVSLTAGTGGIVALSANDNTAEIGTAGASVSLLTNGPIGSSTNRIQFADHPSTTQQVVSVGSAAIQPSSVYLDGLGSLTLGSVLGGANTTVDITARTELTVSAGATINSGASTLSLGADLTAAETGDNGVGTLSINAGATVISSNASANAIKLRGADINIDSSPNPAAVGADRHSSTTPSVTYSSGLNVPEALAFDSSGNLYVANNGAGTVSEYAAGGTTLTATYYGLSAPDALAFDSSGNLYVANGGAGTVSEYAAGGTALTATYYGLSSPDALAFDSSGNLYVANYVVNATVSEFAAGSTTLVATYSGLSGPAALAFDSSGNLYVANKFAGTVSEFAAGGTTLKATYSDFTGPDALAFDSSGNLYVADDFANTVSEFAAGGTTLMATYSGFSYPVALAFDSSGNLYVANDNSFGAVSEFAAGSTTLTASYSGLDGPDSLAFDPSGNLYVATFYNSMVSEFSLGSATSAAGGVVIQSSVESRPMLIGGTNSNPVAGVNLTSAELAQIYTTSTGAVTIGDNQQTGNITLSTATPATTPGAAVNVIQSTSGAGQIILDDGAGTATALNGAGGTVALTPGAGGVQTTLFATGIPLATDGFTASGETLNLTLGFAPAPGTQLTLINNTATPAASNPIGGTFSNLPQGGMVSASYAGKHLQFPGQLPGGRRQRPGANRYRRLHDPRHLGQRDLQRRRLSTKRCGDRQHRRRQLHLLRGHGHRPDDSADLHPDDCRLVHCRGQRRGRRELPSGHQHTAGL